MRHPEYAKYKDSGVEWLGFLPDHWEVTRLANLFTEVDERGNDDLPVLSVSIHDGVSDAELDDSEADRKVTRSDDRSKYKRVAPGDLVYNMMRAWQGGFGTVTVEGMVSPAYVVARPTGNVPTAYIEHLLRTANAVEEMRRHSKGVTDFRLRLYWDEFKNIAVSKPSLQEQESILAFLAYETTKIDALVDEQKSLIDLLKEKRQAVISQAVTKGLNSNVPMKDSGVEWLGKVPAHWELGGLTRFIGPVVDYRGRTPTKVDDGVFLVTGKNIRNGKIDYTVSEEYVDAESAESLLDRGRPEVGDLLFTMEAPLGQVALIDRVDIALAQRIVKFRGRQGVLNSNFLLFWIMGDHCQARLTTLATGSTALGIKASKLGMIECLVPPLDEQAKIVQHLEREIEVLDALVEQAQVASTLLVERRSALISAAVTGKIDMRSLAPQTEGAAA